MCMTLCRGTSFFGQIAENTWFMLISNKKPDSGQFQGQSQSVNINSILRIQ